LLPTRTDEHEKAVSDLFDKYKNLVYKTAYLMYGNQEEAEEALQEVFLQVYRFLPGYDPAKEAVHLASPHNHQLLPQTPPESDDFS